MKKVCASLQKLASQKKKKTIQILFESDPTSLILLLLFPSRCGFYVLVPVVFFWGSPSCCHTRPFDWEKPGPFPTTQ